MGSERYVTPRLAVGRVRIRTVRTYFYHISSVVVLNAGKSEANKNKDKQAWTPVYTGYPDVYSTRRLFSPRCSVWERQYTPRCFTLFLAYPLSYFGGSQRRQLRKEDEQNRHLTFLY